jgi:hypothetical protein
MKHYLVAFIIILTALCNSSKGELMAAETQLDDGLYAKIITAKGDIPLQTLSAWLKAPKTSRIPRAGPAAVIMTV